MSYFEKASFCVSPGCEHCGTVEKMVEVWLDRIIWQKDNVSALYFLHDKHSGSTESIHVSKKTSEVDFADPVSDLAPLFFEELSKKYPSPLKMRFANLTASMDV